MCGISGFYNENVVEASSSYINSMMRKINHRGPDSDGIWKENSIVMGHKRLAILDLSAAGGQPMKSHCNRYVLCYNGEIYNRECLKSEVERLNPVNWKGHSDTEILLEHIAEFGLEASLKKANGMFAFALWDRELELLYIARDRFGEKPVYYSATERTISFASELTSLTQSPEFNYKIDQKALFHYFQKKYFPAPFTIYKSAKKIEPGFFLTWKKGVGVTLKCYSNWLDVYQIGMKNPFRGSFEEAINELDLLLQNSVKSRMDTDVPLGSFLSGGIDSSLITSILSTRSSSRIKTFTIGFDFPGYDEAVYAKEIAKYLGTEHYEEYISEKNILSEAISIGSKFDEPFADSSQIPTYIVSKMARKEVKVCMTGDGGDELFTGYDRYALTEQLWMKIKKSPLSVRVLLKLVIDNTPDWFLTYLFSFLKKEINQFSNKGKLGVKVKKIGEFLPAKNIKSLYRTMMSLWKRPNKILLNFKEKPEDPLPNFPEFKHAVEYMAFHDLNNYLPGDILTKIDRASMAVGLEGRVPFLDISLTQFSSTLPLNYKYENFEGKIILKYLLQKYIPKDLFDRPKKGFSIPLDNWLRGPLKSWAEELLSPQIIDSQGILNSKEIQLVWKMHLSGKSNFSSMIWTVLMFQDWLRNNRYTY